MPIGLGVSLGIGGGRPATSSGAPSAAFSNSASIRLDGTNDYVDIPDSTDLELSAFSWSVWFKVDTLAEYANLVDTSTSSSFGNGFTLFMRPTGHASAKKICWRSYKAADDIHSSTEIAADTWYHVVATHATGADKLYLYGSLVASGSAANFSVSDVANLRFGSSNQFSLYMDGFLDEISFFSSALSASDASAIYNSGTPADLDSYSPVGWWRMGDICGSSGTNIANQGSGSSIDGTLTNGPTFTTDVPT